MEKAGSGAVAPHLGHFLLAKAGVPLVRGNLTMVPFEMMHKVSGYTAKLNADNEHVGKDFIQFQIYGKTGKSFAMNKRWRTLNSAPLLD